MSWNFIEGIVGFAAGWLAGSVALIGFGVDSFVETTSAAIVGWRFWQELHGGVPERAEQMERQASRAAGALLILLALYILADAGRRLLGQGRQPEESIAGIVLTAVSLGVMPLLARAKLKTARALRSAALRADSYETVACAWLSLTTLAGLTLNATFHWWWADPLAALALVPLIAREGLEGLRGEKRDRAPQQR